MPLGPRADGTPVLPATLIVVMAVTVLAGCIGGTGEATDDGGDDPVADNDTPLDPDEVRNRTEETNSTVEIDKNQTFKEASDFHPHDYWNLVPSRTIVTAAEGTVEVDWESHYSACLPFCPAAPTVTIDVPERRVEGTPLSNFVFAGTGKMELTLSWESQGGTLGADPVLCVKNTFPNAFSCFNSDMYNATRTFEESGETWTITSEDHPDLLSRRTWDPPHSSKSNWRFGIDVCRTAPLNRCVPDVDKTRFSLEVTVHRGNDTLPVDPPHFSYFGEEEALTVADGMKVRSGTIFNGPNWWYRTSPFQSDRQAIATIGAIDLRDSDQPVIPPETRQVVVDLAWSSSNDASLELGYRAANDRWEDPWETPDPTDCSSSLDRCSRYVIPIESGMTDSPYAHRTQWAWAIFSDDPGLLSGDIQMTITAEK